MIQRGRVSLPGSGRSGPPKTAVGSREPGNDLEADPVGMYTPDTTQVIELFSIVTEPVVLPIDSTGLFNYQKW